MRNVPFRGRSALAETLQHYIDHELSLGRTDLATAFLLRCLTFCDTEIGSVAVVTPQNWFFQVYYTELRKHLLETAAFHASAHLGPGAFATIGGEVVKPSLSIISAVAPEEGRTFVTVDLS